MKLTKNLNLDALFFMIHTQDQSEVMRVVTRNYPFWRKLVPPHYEQHLPFQF